MSARGARASKAVYRARRRLRRWLGGSPFEIVFHEKYTAAFPDVPSDALRAERILAFLAAEHVVSRRSVHRPEPVWLKALERVHDPEYLDSLHDVSTLTSILTSRVAEDRVDRILDFHRLQTGGTLMATRRALRHGVAVNLGGGFHHARRAQGAGFCLVNDVAAAIADERRRFRDRVLVVDLDLHDGDGTRDLFKNDEDVFTYSVHARHWGSVDAISSMSIELGSGVDDGTYLEAVRGSLPRVFEDFRPRLVFYLAGCDPARDDYLGDWKITPRAMLERDLFVASLARSAARRIPLVILLAGGYGQQAWRYTARFLAHLGCRRPPEPPSTEEISFARYRHISRLLDPAELSGAAAGNDFGLSEEDLYLPGWGVMKETRFLGFYSRHGIELALERTGFLDRLRDRGFSHPTLDLQLDDPGGQTVRLFGGPSREELLVELRVVRDRRSVRGCELLRIEWLLMQNPRARFGPGRPQLPGQEHPGLGMLSDMIALLTVACERLHLDGLVFVPSEFHVAAYGRSRLVFLDPVTRVRFEALWELFRETSLRDAARAIAEERVVDAETGEIFRWHPEPMLLPVSEKLRKRMEEDRADDVPRPRFHLRSAPADRPSAAP